MLRVLGGSCSLAATCTYLVVAKPHKAPSSHDVLCLKILLQWTTALYHPVLRLPRRSVTDEEGGTLFPQDACFRAFARFLTCSGNLCVLVYAVFVRVFIMAMVW